jgi:sulfate adenylyltransferase subunit 1
MIVSIDAQPQTGLSFDAHIVALQPEGIEPGKRYWLKSGSRRQRVQVRPVSQLELKTGAWNPAERLYMNAIGKVRLAFDEAAIFDPYEQNRSTGSFILVDPDTNNTVAGGMVTGKRSELGGLHAGDARVILSLPADLADQIMASELFANRRDEAHVHRMTAAEAAELWKNAASDI